MIKFIDAKCFNEIFIFVWCKLTQNVKRTFRYCVSVSFVEHHVFSERSNEKDFTNFINFGGNVMVKPINIKVSEYIDLRMVLIIYLKHY